MRLLPIITLTLALLSACSGKQGEVVLRGSLKNLQQAQFLLYTLDDDLARIDTINVVRGSFEHTYPTSGNITLHLVYPHLAEQIIFAGSGDIIDIEGDATNLRNVIVSGNDDNEKYTRLRLTLNELLTNAARDSLIEAFIAENPTSRISVYLIQQRSQSTPTDPLLRKGEPLPDFRLDAFSTDSVADKQSGRHLFNADSLTLADLKGHRSIIAVWANWRNNSAQDLYYIRRFLRENADMVSLSINTDVVYANHTRIARRDSIFDDKYKDRWWTYCDQQGLSTPILKEWGICEVPYYIYVDAKGIVKACGNNFDEDIKPFVK